ncbi:MAG: hypothetical protein HYZ54_00060 [Ignavibacteriae bacterium]|nr:hypothetical protein [Ignavibacteriota bacterium]
MVKIPLSINQFDAIANEYDETFYIGGIGSGKSFVLGVFVYNEARLAGSVGLITAPVTDTLNNSTLHELKNVWAQLGLIQDIHYVVGIAPPDNWCIESYSRLNTNILTWRWGSYTIVDGSDNFNKHRGLELDYVAADEFRDIKNGAWQMYRGRMRGKAKKIINGKYRMLAVTTPPDDPAKIDHTGGLRAYHAFSEENIIKQDFIPNAPTVMSWDFNASPKKPMSTGLIQEVKGKYYLTKEFIFKNSNTDEQCQKILEFFQRNSFSGTLTITGDYSGHRKESNATRSDYAIIEYYFSRYPDYRLKTRPTLSIRDRVASLNAQFRNMAGERGLWVDSRCVKHIEDLYKTRWKESGAGLDDSDPERTHPSDELSYWAYNFFPIDKKEIMYG